MDKRSFKQFLRDIGLSEGTIRGIEASGNMLPKPVTHHKDSSLPVTVSKYPKPSLKPNRDTIITEDEILNLKIDLNNCNNSKQFLEMV